MPYKISGYKSHTARVVVLKESDWSVESNTIVSGSGSYEIENLVSGTKSVFGRRSDGWVEGFGSVESTYYAPPDKGVFAGGSDGSPTNVIDAITVSTTGNATNFGDLTYARYHLEGCSNGANNRGLFGGGYAIPSRVNIIDYITISTSSDATNFGDLSQTMEKYGSTSNGTTGRGVFGGGSYYSGGTVYIKFIDYVAISTPGNGADFGDLSVARNLISATSNKSNDRGVFAGGYLSGGTFYQNIIDYITISSTGNSSNFGDMTAQKRDHTSTSNSTNNRGVFGAGQTTGGSQNVIEYITINSIGDAQNFGDLSGTKYGVGSASNGTNERGVFAGGSGTINVIDYITISSIGDSQDFGDLAVARWGMDGTENA